jgi:hypothetical protein
LRDTHIEAVNVYLFCGFILGCFLGVFFGFVWFVLWCYNGVILGMERLGWLY